MKHPALTSRTSGPRAARRHGLRAHVSWCAGALRRAFTLIELLVSIGIILLATMLLVPSFAKIIESTSYTAAVNTVTAVLGGARAAAIRTGRSTGVAFLFDLQSKTYTLQVLEIQSQGGSGYLTNLPAAQKEGTYCQAFRPAVGQAPVALPRGMGVYGLSYAVTRVNGSNAATAKIDGNTWHWYAGDIIDEGSTSSANPETFPWLFPRNDGTLFMRDGVSPWPNTGVAMTSEQRDAVRHANSFFIQFDASGSVVSASSEGGRSLQNAFLELPGVPIDLDSTAAVPLELDVTSNFDPENRGTNKRTSPNPEVILRAAYALAVVDFTRMSKETGIDQPWLVRPSTSKAPKRLDLPDALFYDNARTKTIGRWIDRNAEVITFNRFSGTAARRPAL